MRKVFLLVALSMIGALVFAGPATAQDFYNCEDLTYGEAQLILGEDPSDPNGLDADNDGEACDENAPSGGSSATPEATMMEESATPTAEEEMEESASSSATASASATAEATASATALPETGGASQGGSLAASMALPSLALLLGSGLLAFRLVRRS